MGSSSSYKKGSDSGIERVGMAGPKSMHLAQKGKKENVYPAKQSQGMKGGKSGY